MTGEHGVGVEKLNSMCAVSAAENAQMFGLKHAFDPAGLLEPWQGDSHAEPVRRNTGRCWCAAGRSHPDLPQFLIAMKALQGLAFLLLMQSGARHCPTFEIPGAWACGWHGAAFAGAALQPVRDAVAPAAGFAQHLSLLFVPWWAWGS